MRVFHFKRKNEFNLFNDVSEKTKNEQQKITVKRVLIKKKNFA